MACAPIPTWRTARRRPAAAADPGAARGPADPLALWWAWSLLPWTLGLAAARGLWRR